MPLLHFCAWEYELSLLPWIQHILAVGGDGLTTYQSNLAREALMEIENSIPSEKRYKEFGTFAKSLRADGKRVVFTNGVFDILHVGHLRYLEAARALGDALLIGVNADASVRRLKGPTRPINPEVERAELLAALRCVDGVCVFSEDTPMELIKAVRPDIHAKGGDYASPDVLPETPLVRSLGGEVVILQLIPDRSTTRTIERMKQPD
ncbi:MAG: D-glycero-beta-D-manno-heptose 1-phosphate adenylyltransferase [Fibrella sp.]|nr:D-glycero-beta-D-manno-heptose 1-phosphate adenylyltransferase [Armatimonadota bacterium]